MDRGRGGAEAGQVPPGNEPPRTNHNNTEPRANITDPDVWVMRVQQGYVTGYNGQLVVTAQQAGEFSQPGDVVADPPP